MNTSDILLDKSLNNITKVYLIANYFHDKHQIADDLWYAILDLKDEYLKDIQIKYDIDYFK